ncbi:type II toxin-antitoxin system ParD family antitoxin [Vibrio metschnikovii]|nr:type II toxin-antitoxin system ParD family antitoxin [Vibrio metschnikovii]
MVRTGLLTFGGQYLRAGQDSHQSPQQQFILPKSFLDNSELRFKVNTLRQLLVEGEGSGIADYDLDSLINELDNEIRK